MSYKIESRDISHFLPLGLIPMVLALMAGDLNAATANRPPVIIGAPALKVKVGAPFNFAPVASDPDGDPLTFSITNKPGWMTFNPATGALTGSPTNANIGLSPLGYMISVNDGKGGTAKLATYNVLVQAAASANTPPVITGVPALSAKIGEVFSFSPAASDANNDPLTFNIANKPAWAIFDPATGKLSGTPTAADAGLSKAGYVISVNDGKGGAANLAAFNINVVGSSVAVPNQPPLPMSGRITVSCRRRAILTTIV